MSQAAYWNQMYANAIDQSEPSQRYRPSLSIDGDQWCALYGENLQDGVAGFGDSPGAAFWAFDRAWWTKLKSGVAGVSPTPTLLKEKSMLDGMKAARDALVEYYRAEAPVMVMIEASITEAEEYSRAYEILFKEHGRLRSLCCQLYETERDKNQQDWTAVIRALEKIGADSTAAMGSNANSA